MLATKSASKDEALVTRWQSLLLDRMPAAEHFELPSSNHRQTSNAREVIVKI